MLGNEAAAEKSVGPKGELFYLKQETEECSLKLHGYIDHHGTYTPLWGVMIYLSLRIQHGLTLLPFRITAARYKNLSKQSFYCRRDCRNWGDMRFIRNPE